MADDNTRLELERQALAEAKSKGLFGKLGTYTRLSGPGWLQSAITLGGGSLAGSLYLGILGGYEMMWLQPLMMIFGIVMLSSIGYVALSTGKSPFHEINRHVNPVLGWGWAIATLMANLVWAMPQFSLGTAAMQQNLGVLPDTRTGEWIGVAILFAVGFTVVWFYDSGGRGIKLFEIILKIMVGVIVLSFFAVVVAMSAGGAGLPWGDIFSGFVPNPDLLNEPADSLAPLVAASSAPEHWSAVIVDAQRDRMVAAAATAVGINMTFLLPFSMLKRGWNRNFRGLATFDLSTGLFIPFVLATSCVVIAAASQFHARPEPALLSDKDHTKETFAIRAAFRGNLDKAIASVEGRKALDVFLEAAGGDTDEQRKLIRAELIKAETAAVEKAKNKLADAEALKTSLPAAVKGVNDALGAEVVKLPVTELALARANAVARTLAADKAVAANAAIGTLISMPRAVPPHDESLEALANTEIAAIEAQVDKRLGDPAAAQGDLEIVLIDRYFAKLKGPQGDHDKRVTMKRIEGLADLLVEKGAVGGTGDADHAAAIEASIEAHTAANLKDPNRGLGHGALDARRMSLPEADKKLAATLIQRDAGALASSLENLAGKGVSQYVFGIGVVGMAISTIIILMLINGFTICEMLKRPSRGFLHRFGCLLPGISGALGFMYLWSDKEAHFYLAVPTSRFGMVLLPIAYIGFFLMMNNRKVLGDEMPRGGKRMLINLSMLIAVGLALVGAGVSILNEKAKLPNSDIGVREVAFGVIGALVLLAIIVHFKRKGGSSAAD